jgi:hypothetical protein
LYYGYQGSGWNGPTLGAFGFGPKSDEDRMQWMDYKDRMKEKGKNEFFPMQTAMIGFGVAAVLLTPFGWIGATSVGTILGYKKLKKEWVKRRTLNAYGRIFVFDSKSRVIEVTKSA